MDFRKELQNFETFKKLLYDFPFYDLITGGFFDNRKDFPNSPGMTTCPTCGSKYKDPVKKAAFDRKRKEYNEEQARLENLFKEALFYYTNVSDNPKANSAYSIAWEKGHSSGLAEVYNEFLDLVVLIQ